LTAQTNDALIAALCVWTIAVGTERPMARGLLMAAAALTKFILALLALQFLGEKRRRWRYALALAAMLAWPLITSGPASLLDSTFGYQLMQRGGGTQFSIWTYLPPRMAIVARLIVAAALLLLALSPVVRPPVRDTRQQAALAAALLIGGQLLLGYWFYSYITWCYPLLVVAVIQARPDHEAADPRQLFASANVLGRSHELAASRRGYRERRILTGRFRSANREAQLPEGLQSVTRRRWLARNTAPSE
jgi:hypothetical protein